MTTITLRVEWDMGHRLPNHEGKCRRLHGHRYVAEVDVSGELTEEGSEQGMVMDFGHLKILLKTILDDPETGWDHRTLLWNQDIEMIALLGPDAADYGVLYVPFVPTAENIAEAMFTMLEPAMPSGVLVTRVRIYETTNGWAEVA